MVRRLSRRFATNRELIRILLFTFKAPTSQKVCLLGKLAAVELGVEAACRQQLVMRAALDNLAVAHH